MKILVIADVESKSLWDYFHPKKLEGIELIISCGDLNPKYLSFLATFFHGDVLYVHGNHDEIYESDPPLGCVCVEDRIVVYKGIRIMGLGGSIDYNGGKFQYTQKEMNRRCRKLWFALKKHSGIDILVTHAPAFKMNDGISTSGISGISKNHRLLASKILCSWTYSFELWTRYEQSITI